MSEKTQGKPWGARPMKETTVAPGDELLIMDSEDGNIIKRILADMFRGAGIKKIELSDTEGLIDIYTIFFENGQTFDYTITNGEKGDRGLDWISGGFDEEREYRKDEVCLFEGSSFIYINDEASIGNYPPNLEKEEKNEFWELLAKKGADGTVEDCLMLIDYDPGKRREQVAFEDDLLEVKENLEENYITKDKAAEKEKTISSIAENININGSDYQIKHIENMVECDFEAYKSLYILGKLEEEYYKNTFFLLEDKNHTICKGDSCIILKDYTATLDSTELGEGGKIKASISLSNGGKFLGFGKIVTDENILIISDISINTNGILEFICEGISQGNSTINLVGFTDNNGELINITNTINKEIGIYTVEKLTQSGTWVIPSTITHIDIAVAGGGGGGATGRDNISSGAGGGAGGLIYIENYNISKYGTQVSFTIGAGGSAYNNGGNTVFGNLIAFGGGGGGRTNNNGMGGGSGGGHGYGSSIGGNSTQAINNDGYNNTGFGNAGGAVSTSNSTGGGGAGGVGSNSGGAGKTVFGILLCKGGDARNGKGIAGEVNTGNGGGGSDGHYQSYPGGGGSGVIIIRYKKTK